ncbi:hypothetical protein QRX60_34440 [Amycolatopsis mongoliensis]|uniref:DUF3592 domain-containing protein n=1 Tax=Amycolatopsis mongoliensis TaxID=715475 RepID=A0A9Y2JKV8_9PSEU|nr:DUF3592 domain-containing protein [Amycolatopsis sp. 4-36]WIX99126.1 hypothetical protein QRX60_34440 [Amycolatopsis sp. 4-36]
MTEPVPVAWVRPRRPRRRPRPRPRGLRGRAGAWITVAGLVPALAAALGAFAVQRYEAHLRGSGTETLAEVTGHDRVKLSYNVSVTFTTKDGREIVTTLYDFPREPPVEIGDRLTIRYDPDRPDVTLWDVRDPPSFTGATIFMASLATVLAVASFVFRYFTRRSSTASAGSAERHPPRRRSTTP